MPNRFSITLITMKWVLPVALGTSVLIIEDVARAQAVGSEGQACYPNDTCNAGLTCASHLCVNMPGNANGQPNPQVSQQVPQTVAVSEPPQEINNWRVGTPIPPGYHAERRPRWELVVGGAAAWGFVYLPFNVLPAASSIDVCKGQVSNCDNAVFLFIPVFGPFAQMSTVSAQNSALAMVFLSVDAAAQIAAITVSVVGLAWQRDYLKRGEGGDATSWKPTILPYVTGNSAGLFGTF